MPNRRNTYVNLRFAQLIEEYGSACVACKKTYDLEFAHRTPTKCVGMGRGKSRRLTDILQHPQSYYLLCRTCHDELDGRTPRIWHTKGGPQS